jgi:polyisoprenoid-binding protein YceI
MSQLPVNKTKVASAILPAGSWNIDRDHSGVEFVARLLGSRVRGRFTGFTGVITVDPDPSRSFAEVTIDAASIDTDNKKRDAHLRSSAFLDVEEFPILTFRSMSVTPPQADGSFRVEGDLTIRGVTRAVVLDALYLGSSDEPSGSKRAKFSARTELDREEFGVSWNILGSIRKRVQIELEIEAIWRADSAQE